MNKPFPLKYSISLVLSSSIYPKHGVNYPKNSYRLQVQLSIRKLFTATINHRTHRKDFNFLTRIPQPKAVREANALAGVRHRGSEDFERGASKTLRPLRSLRQTTNHYTRASSFLSLYPRSNDTKAPARNASANRRGHRGIHASGNI